MLQDAYVADPKGDDTSRSETAEHGDDLDHDKRPMGIGAADRMTYRCLVMLLPDRISRREDAVVYRAGSSN
jgi:hypothetical protein